MDKVQCDSCRAKLSDRTALKQHLLALHKRKLLPGLTHSAVASSDELDVLWVSDAARRKRESSTLQIYGVPRAADRLPPSTPQLLKTENNALNQTSRLWSCRRSLEFFLVKPTRFQRLRLVQPSLNQLLLTDLQPRVDCSLAVFLAVDADEGQLDCPSTPTRDEPNYRQDALWSPRPLLSSTATVVSPSDT